MKFSRMLKKYPQLNADELQRKMSDRLLVQTTSQEIRQKTERGEKEPCYVCGRYQEICHLHHIVPVEELTIIVVYFDLFNEDLYIPTVWLCPNHHAIYHFVVDRNNTIDLSIGEMEKYAEIGKMFNAERYQEMLAGYKRRTLTSVGNRNGDSQLALPIFDTMQTSTNSWASNIERKAMMRKQRIRQEWNETCDMLIKGMTDFLERMPSPEDARRAFGPNEWAMYDRVLEQMETILLILQQMEAGINYEPTVKKLGELLRDVA